MIKVILFLAALFAIPVIFFFSQRENEQILPKIEVSSESSPVPSSTTADIEIPRAKIIPIKTHAFQTFNNCGPTALSMQLSYWGISASQQTLGQKLRPFQNPQGDNDDKSVTLEELAKEAEARGLVAFHRPNGDTEKIKSFIAADIPVVARTLLVLGDDIGHYRLIRGYDDNAGEFIQDDSLQSANSRYTYGAFERLWRPYNFEYLVIVPKEDEQTARAILGEEADARVAWENSLERINDELKANSNDIFSQFNLANTLYHLGRYGESVSAFEKVESRLSFRTLWYQIEPILAYKELGDNQRVFELTNKILNNHNRAFSELYIIRGDIYREQGDLLVAKSEYEKAVLYNSNLTEAVLRLESVS